MQKKRDISLLSTLERECNSFHWVDSTHIETLFFKLQKEKANCERKPVQSARSVTLQSEY